MVKKLKYGEMFSGPGGLSLGAKFASDKSKYFEIIHSWATDYDKEACKTYGENICGDPYEKSVICDDIRAMNIASLDYVNIFSFGFPCNDFSLVGEHLGTEGIYGPLYTYAGLYLKRKKPDIFVAENVSGLTSANEGKAFKTILKTFIKTGYRVTVNKFKFEFYGVPQKRHRIVIVGLKENMFKDYFKIPEEVPKFITAKEALEKPKIKENAFNNEFTKHPQQTIERLKLIQPGENAWTAKLPEKLKLNVKGAKLSQIYRRLKPNEPSYTITGSGGGGTHVYHYDMKENRALTNRERARLQSFPDDYFFHGNKEDVRRQIGMAVPPVGAEKIFSAILKTMSGEEYKSQKPSVGYFDKNNFDEIERI